MAQNILFNYKSSSKHKINTFVFAALSLIPMYCFISIMATGISIIIAEAILSINLSNVLVYLFFFIFTIFVIITTLSSIRKALRSLTITTEEITWETFSRKTYTLNREKVSKVERKSNLLILNQKLKIYTSSFSKKDMVLFDATLFNWLPDGVLDFDTMQFRKNKDKYLPNRDYGEPPICAESNKRKNSIIRRLGIAFSIVLILLVFFVFSIEQEAGRIFLFLSGVILLIFFAAWVNTTYQAIQVNDNEITYQKGRKSRTYNWQNIESIAIELRYHQFLIWENNKERKLSYSHIKTENVNEVATAIFQQTLIHDIPFGAL